jgi:hypothetical protein
MFGVAVRREALASTLLDAGAHGVGREHDRNLSAADSFFDPVAFLDCFRGGS